jgi:Flp pilus assembly protein TadG
MFLRPIRSSKGTSIMEFSLVLPLLLVLILTIADFGIYFFISHTVQFATREGVRLALVGRTVADPQGNMLSREGSIIQTIQEKAKIAVSPSTLRISIYPVAANFTDPLDWQNTQDAGGPGSYMRVKTFYEYKFVTPLLAALVPNGKLPVLAQATYRNELF